MFDYSFAKEKIACAKCKPVLDAKVMAGYWNKVGDYLAGYGGESCWNCDKHLVATDRVTKYIENPDNVPMFDIEGDIPVAYCFDREDGVLMDMVYSWETAQNMAVSHKVVVVTGDGSKTKEEVQSIVDAETRMYNDCFGSNLA